MKLSKIKNQIYSFWPLVVIFLVVSIFFWKFFLKGWLPIPADTIVGMYHPWRDIVWDNFTAGVPFKNFLITDPVRQQFPWRQLVIDLIRQGKMPLWNPYSFAGTPLLANFQSATFYFLNSIFLILNSKLAWGILIFLQPLLAGMFTYFYLHHLRLKKPACLLGALTFSLSGFFIAWLEWGTVLHSALWLPLVLLAIDKILRRQNTVLWSALFVFALVQSFFAGHLQVFFYVFLFSAIYFLSKLFRTKKKLKLFFLFIILYSIFFILTSPQWRPTWEFIRLSARGVDQADWAKPGWFIPFKHLVQFLAPDFFGNPTTLNYWGEWNYAEFVGFIGVIPLLLAGWALFERRARFFGFACLLILSFALPTPWSKLIYRWQMPFLSTSQPTRLLFLVDFCLACLAALGLDSFIKKGKKLKRLVPFLAIYGCLWLFVLLAKGENLVVSQRNLILPTGILIVFTGLVVVKKKFLILSAIIFLTVFDLIRFGWKFTPFVKKDWLFPQARTIEFLQKDDGVFRIMAVDDRVFPPNFAVAYQLQDVSGYDPLYLHRYGELIAALERGKPNIAPPFGFNRIITPQNYNSRIIDLLNVKYVLSLTDLSLPKLGLAFKEGETRIYGNRNFFPRAFMVYNYRFAENKQEAIELLMDSSINLHKKVILEEILPVDLVSLTNEDVVNNVIVEKYEANRVIIGVKTAKNGILVLTDSYYPAWKAKIDDKETKIYRANYNFRAVIVPQGEHKVEFKL